MIRYRPGACRQKAQWLVFYAIRDGYVKARAIQVRTGLTKYSVFQALQRLRDAGAVHSAGPNHTRTHSLLTRRPPKDMTGKWVRPNVRPPKSEPSHLWQVWR